MFLDIIYRELEPYIYSLGIGGICLSLLLISLEIIMYVKKIKINKFFGYRTLLAYKSEKTWRWCNDTCAKLVFVFGPITLLIHVIIFTLSAIYQLNFIWIVVSFLLSILYYIPIILFIEIYGWKKFKDK